MRTDRATLAPVAAELLADVAGATAPSGAVLAIAEGEDVHIGAAGVDDVDTGALVGPLHAQDIASVSKVLTTLTVLGLVDRGAISLDSTLGDLLDPRAGHHADVTVESLLRHRGGLRQWWPLYLEPSAADDPIAAVLALPPLGPHDTSMAYSDLGMLVLGAAVERVAGAPLVDVVREVLLEPIGATTISPGRPRSGAPALAGPDGDAIEREMVRSGVPYRVDVSDDGFEWRTRRITREPVDGNAFHAFGGAVGHAGWFADIDGLLRVASVLVDPAGVGVARVSHGALASTIDEGQGLGVRRYSFRWRGRDRVLIGHPGFTGAFVGAAAASDGDPAVRIALLANRLHGRPAPRRDGLVDVESLWRRAVASADTILNPSTSGARP